MNDKIMSKATFSEICKIMKGDKTDVWECISGLFGISLLFFPELICKETAVLTNISNGTNIVEHGSGTAYKGGRAVGIVDDTA